METQRLERLVSNIQKGTPQQEQRRGCETESPVMLRFWLRMTEMYGTLWSNSQGDEPNETWAMGLDILKPKEIGAGLVALRDCAKPFPPTLPEFIGLCRHQNAPSQHLMSRSCNDVLNAPIVDRGEKCLPSPAPNAIFGDFKAMWANA